MNSEKHIELLKALNMCGCGNADDVLIYLYSVLTDIKYRKDSQWAVNPLRDRLVSGDMTLSLALYYLESNKLLEHDGSVGGSWLSEKGEKFLADLTDILPELQA